MSNRAAIYVRQSVDKSEGIARQKTRCRALCEARGFDVFETYEDNDVSASKARGAKTAWARMLKDAEAGLFDVVVAVDVDRLLRSMADLVTLTGLGVSVLTVSGEIDLTTADGAFRAQMLAAIAEFETKRKGERHARANLARIAEGKPVPGRRRYGYEPDNMTPREPEASDVRALYAEFNAGASIRSLGMARGWRFLRVRETLQNPSYKGWVVHKGVASPGRITPLVSDDVWDAAQLRLSDPTRRTTPGRTPKHLLSGIAVCGVCGQTMHFMRSYRCRELAGHPSILKEKLEQLVSDEVLAWAFNPTHAAPEPEGALLDLLKKAADLTDRRGALEELFLLPGADRPRLAREITALAEQSAEVEAEIEKERYAASLVDVLGTVRAGWWAQKDEAVWTELEEAAVEAWPAYWESLSFETKREVIRGVFSAVVVNPGRIAEERVEFHLR